MGHCYVDKCLAGARQQIIVLSQTAITSQPSKGALDHPATGQHTEAFLIGRLLNNLKRQALFGLGPLNQLAAVAAIGPDMLQTRKGALAALQNELGAIAILNTGRMDFDLKHQAVRIYEKMSLTSFDMLARIIANSVLFFRPPFSAVLTDWLSITAAEGVGSLPC